MQNTVITPPVAFAFSMSKCSWACLLLLLYCGHCSERALCVWVVGWGEWGKCTRKLVLLQYSYSTTAISSISFWKQQGIQLKPGLQELVCIAIIPWITATHRKKKKLFRCTLAPDLTRSVGYSVNDTFPFSFCWWGDCANAWQNCIFMKQGSGPCSNMHNHWSEPLQQTEQVKICSPRNKVSLRNLKMWNSAVLSPGVWVQQEVSGEGNIWRSNLEHLTKTSPFFISLS